MRTRTIMTVAILSAAGCGSTGAARHGQVPRPVDAAPATVAAAPAPAPTPTVTAVPAPVIAASTATAPAAPAAPLAGEQLDALALELRNTDPVTVSVQLAHFRPLCDAQGYPLVGNLMNKSADAGPGPIEAYCADVRARTTP